MIAVCLTCVALIWVVAIPVLFRNQAVCSERLRVAAAIHELNCRDSAAGMEYDNWRYMAFNEITYDEMLYRFWIPVGDFYRNHRCLSRSFEGEMA